MLSALVPLVIAPEPGNPVSVAIGIVSWLVFVVDLVVHQRLLHQYLRTGLGKVPRTSELSPRAGLRRASFCSGPT